MGNQLPEAFAIKMERLLGAEYPAFLASYDEDRWYGLRVNTLKCSVERFVGIAPMRLEPIPWASAGFYYSEEDRPGKHPYYHAGLYYIQEPSAMAPVELLDVRPGDRVLDLCAAPGGKSTQIASRLAGEGLLVANDIHPDRIKALVKNIELNGVRNAVILNERPEKLQHAFHGYFDKILIDAPCSGEGMFRKEEEMAKAWQPDWVDRYAGMQRDLLKQAAAMLRPGGRMVYSTCTFSPEENEEMIAEFLRTHAHFQVVPVAAEHGIQPGRPEWVEHMEFGSAKAADATRQVGGTARLWPHYLKGEGHFVAVLEHQGDHVPALSKKERIEHDWFPGKGRLMDKKSFKKQTIVDLEPFYSFMKQMAPSLSISNMILHGEYVYVAPEGLPDLSGIRVIRPGWYMGSIRKQRFEPAHALAMGLSSEEAQRSILLSVSEGEAVRYLKGETLELSEERVSVTDGSVNKKGYCLVCIDGFPAGWGKWIDGMLKNEYPPSWRWT